MRAQFLLKTKFTSKNPANTATTNDTDSISTNHQQHSSQDGTLEPILVAREPSTTPLHRFPAPFRHGKCHVDSRGDVGILDDGLTTAFLAFQVRYAATEIESAKSARARGSYLRVSFKNTRETAQAINGWKLTRAVKFLENVQEKTEAVPMRRYAGSTGRTAQGTTHVHAVGKWVSLKSWPHWGRDADLSDKVQSCFCTLATRIGNSKDKVLTGLP